MPFTHIDIQRERQRTSALLFLLLLLYYVLGFLVLWSLLHPVFHLINLFSHIHPWLSLRELGVVVLVAVVVAAGHWLIAVSGGVERILASLRAQPLDPQDRYHRQFLNIVEEARVATGGRHIRPVVIPTIAVNAFAVATTEKNGVIGVTEGLLARLNRPQLEAVVAHEAAHLLHHDSIMTTIACSLFGVFAQLLRISRSISTESERNQPVSVIWLFVPILWLFAGGARLLNVAISRQREYLADATAVRLTQNPTALAEALLKMSHCWRGVNETDESLAPIFIVNPGERRLDHEESFLADLFSTHPPIERRVEILAALARTDIPSLSSSIQHQPDTANGAAADSHTTASPVPSWWINSQATWQGPYSADRLMALAALRPDSWICRDKADRVTRAADDPLLLEIMRARTAENPASSRACPRCRQCLTPIDYEGTQLDQCRFCLGCLVAEHHIFKILSRREIGFSDELKVKVKQFQKHSVMAFANAHRIPLQQDPSQIVSCPACRHPMLRNFYTYQYRIVVDRCGSCQLIWFDHEELEMLQAMVEASGVEDRG